MEIVVPVYPKTHVHYQALISQRASFQQDHDYLAPYIREYAPPTSDTWHAQIGPEPLNYDLHYYKHRR